MLRRIRLLGLMVGCAVLFVGLMAARAQSSAGPAAQQFAAWLTAFNKADRAQLLAYHEQAFPYSVASRDVGDIEREMGLSSGTGGFDLKKSEGVSATTFTGVLKERQSEQFARATMRVDAAAPHRVVSFEIHPIPTPADLLPPPTSESELKRKKLEQDAATKRYASPQNTPAGKVFAAWLTAFNSADPAKIGAVLKQFREPRPVERALDFRRQTGGFELKKVLELTPTQIRVLVQEQDGDHMAEGRMEVEAAAPHRVTRWDLHIIPRPPEFALPRMTEVAVLEATRAYLDRLSAAERFSGTVIVTRQGKPLLSEVRGMQDRDKKIPNRLDTKFNLGSMNKMFTAVAVAQLVQKGKLKFTDPVGKYLPDYPNAEVAKKVTLHHLLTHTGGMGDIFTPEYDANIANLKEPKDYVALYGKRAPEFEPGSQWAYSNYGMVVAGAIVERVSGMSYYDYVRKNIFQPAGMTSSDSFWKNQDTPNLAKGYSDREGPLKENFSWLPMRGSPAGGGYSTCEDLLRFAAALTSHKLLDAEHTELLTTGKPGTPEESYGYGFGISNEGGVRSFGHGGGAPGINADLKIFPDSGYVVVVMGNYDPPAASRLSDFIAARLPAK